MNLLIVDDSKLIITHVIDILKKNNIKVNIDYAINGEEAIKKLDDKDFDVVLLDIIMPKFTGIEVLKIISRKEYFENLKIIMFSSVSGKKALKECFKFGAFDYLVKPIDEDECIARVTHAIDEQILQNKLKKSIDIMKEQNNKLLELNSEISNMKIKLMQHEQLTSVGKLAAGIAHEINNPMGFINSNIDMLNMYFRDIYKQFYNSKEQLEAVENTEVVKIPIIDFLLSDEAKYIFDDFSDLVKDTKEGINRVVEIVNALRIFSSVDLLNEKTEYDLNKEIDNIVIVLSNRLKLVANVEKNYGKISKIYAYSGILNQTLYNLFSNAIDAIEAMNFNKMGIIRIKTYEDLDYIFLEIEDNGIGISKENMENIFIPFYSTKEVGSAKGLGLSIAYETIVNKHKGELEVISEENKGCLVKIKLPK